MNNLTVLITGASSGIGYELTHIFACHGWNLVLLARNQEKLQHLQELLSKKHQNISIRIITADLSHAGAVEKICDELIEKSITIDMLVNNAGVGNYGSFYQTAWEQEKSMMQLNMLALTELTKRLLPHMMKRGKGKILNVASTAAFMPGPLMAVYYATKAYVLSFSEALANELEGTGIQVSVLCPGVTASEFQKTANMQHSRLAKGNMMSATEVAHIAYHECMRGKTIIIPGGKNKFLVFLIRLLPRFLVTRIVRSSQREEKV